jgi:gluconate 5-dehydrogenase
MGAKPMTEQTRQPDTVRATVSLRPQDLFSLRGKTAVLTGASGFLGRTMAEALLSAEARVVALARSAKLEAIAEEWRARYGRDCVATYQFALDVPGAFDEAINSIVSNEPRIDVLVNNAHQLDVASGFTSEAGSLERMDFSQWSSHLDGGLWWAAHLAQGLGEQLKQARGSVVNVSSMYGLVAPSPNLYSGTDMGTPPGYVVAKAAMLSLTRYIASYWGKYGVRANALVPGPFTNVGGDTENSVDGNDPFLDRLRERTVLGRLGKPEDLAGALIFLASDASSYVTGHALVVDGGWTII